MKITRGGDIKSNGRRGCVYSKPWKLCGRIIHVYKSRERVSHSDCIAFNYFHYIFASVKELRKTFYDY